MALLSALWFSVLLRLSVGSETLNCPALAGVPGSPGHNGLPGRDGRDGFFGPKGEKGEPGHHIDKEEIRNLVEEILQEQPQVAFWATLSGPNSHYRNIGPFEKRHTLVYGSALTNIGNAYDTETGIFTAPVRGVYFFNVMLFNANPPNTGLDIVKNGERVVSITDNTPGQDSEDTASNSVTLLLEKGDQIYNVLLVNRKIYTDQAGRNSFSGHLLYAMPN